MLALIYRYVGFAAALFALMPLAYGGTEGSSADQRGMHLKKELNLSEAQLAQVREIRKKNDESIRAKREAFKAAKEDLVKSLQDPNKGPEYRAQLLEKHKKVQSLKKELAHKEFEIALDIREILTNDQIVKFRALHDHRQKEKTHCEGMESGRQ